MFKMLRQYRRFLKWVKQFNIVPYKSTLGEGHCTNCDGGAEPEIECSEYGCPCKMNEQLIRKNSLPINTYTAI
jgi:hypothetical protein